MVLFVDIFGDAWSIPDVVNPACHDINQDIANHFDISKSQKIINIEGDKHNALYDAKVIKEIYEIVN